MKIRILLADDASFIRDLIKRTIRQFLPQSEITEASDGRKAQAILNRQQVDLVISDWEMPGLTGEELLLWVRGEERLARLPFIMVTSLGDKTHIMRAVQSGVSDYLGKPFTPEELMQKVSKALVNSGKLRHRPEIGGRTGPFSSLEIFSGKPDPVSTTSADALTAPGRSKTPSRVTGTGVVHWQDQEFRCMIKGVNLEEVVMLCKRGKRQPGVFDPITLTLSANNTATQAIAGLDGYVHSIAALEKKPDSEFIVLTLRFRNLGGAQQEALSQFILDQS